MAPVRRAVWGVALGVGVSVRYPPPIALRLSAASLRCHRSRGSDNGSYVASSVSSGISP